MINEQRLLDEFIKLVRIDSETTKERAIIDYLKDKLTKLGTQPIEDNAHKEAVIGAGNLIITIPGRYTKKVTENKRLLFTAHVDTVAPGEGIEPVIRDGYIYSNGTTILGADDKAGVAAILEMLQVIKENSIDHGQIQIVFTVGEECGLLGSKHIDKELLQSDMGIALDSNGNVGRIITSGPVQYSLNATITGKAAHAGVNPEAGISAIEIAAEAITKMNLGRIDEETTANIGVIQGGIATNVVCETLTLKGEARSLNRQKAINQIGDMRTSLEDAVNKRGAVAKIDVNEEYPEFSFDKNDDEMKIIKKAMGNIGVVPECVGSGGGSDANIFNGYGIKTVNLGIGMENIHSVDERIAIEELNKIARLLVEIVKVCS
ncbi:M20/M25/M40 family metallo-hydrolase [Desulfuribacillus alkaliarsenatis]|uniref:Peptidase M20 dimerisation domain-containing protein n=1 Tax=Desulfuribacillus alkaliarsenatis TaxID=766136 RepID=A0A1E5G5M0_9FIRM|nr:M20/M25/M40 family metallo-hydrolase [Desulfuribacillus alkaliarsenatis]OEF98468.1 hypothetical protein BHF68_01980 [Desulfuribacillus alkaliarsenatis]